jgi:hypothetical protein
MGVNKKKSRQPVVPELLVRQIESSLAALDHARTELAGVLTSGAPLRGRREAHARVTHAFDDADALLRRATALARQGSSSREWSLWRRRLSRLDAARQVHLFAERDDPGVRPIGSTRALDTGMSGPAIGEMQHGQACEPGAAPTYGVDVEALLTAQEHTGRAPAAERSASASGAGVGERPAA